MSLFGVNGQYKDFKNLLVINFYCFLAIEHWIQLKRENARKANASTVSLLV